MSNEEGNGQTLVEERTKLQEPRKYKVYLLNDDYTTMDFVVHILETIFQRSPGEATRIMLQVHKQGKGLCGVYSKEIAETKVDLVHQQARAESFPLRAVLEED